MIEFDIAYTAPAVTSFIRRHVGIDGCWNWSGRMYPTGYGRATVRLHDGRWSSTTAHRVVYAAVTGSIDPALDVDHLCRNRRCCNPAHLEQVTRSENLRRGVGDCCRRGHPLTPENTRWQGGRRACRICIRAAAKRRADSDRAAYNARSALYNSRSRARRKASA